MTSPLRRKRQITARGPSISARTAFSLALLALLPAGSALAQTAPPVTWKSAQVSGLPALPMKPPKAPPAGSGVMSAAFQPVPGGIPVVPADEAQEYQIPLEPPGPDRLFRLDSEAQLKERMRQEALNRRSRERIAFPDEPILSRESYAGRSWPEQGKWVEPNYVLYDRLLFQQINFERYGWDLGPISPFICWGGFLAQTITLPYNKFKDPCRCYDSSAGYCLPGDPVPLLLYPPGASCAGLAAEAVAVLGVIAIFP